MSITANDWLGSYQPKEKNEDKSSTIPTAEEFLYSLLSALKESDKVDYLQENPEQAAYYSEKLRTMSTCM